MAKRFLVASLLAPAALTACHSSDDSPSMDLSSDPPTSVARVTSSGFTSPMDAVASLDGSEFYFTAYDMQKQPTVFRTSSTAGSSASVLASGDPLELPTGLVLSCDGATLYIADIGGEDGSVLSVSTSGGGATSLGVTGLVRPNGLAMGPDCATLFITGRTSSGQPALFKVPTTGGAATAVYTGSPLVSPTGLHVDMDGVAWVMDHRAIGMSGEGVLFAIPADGSSADEVVSDLKMGTFGGVSLTAGGGVAVMPTLDATGAGQLLAVSIASGDKTVLPATEMIDPSGLRTARQAAVFAVVDSEGGAIYRAE